MASYTWPATLPQSPLLESLSESPPDVVIRTSFDSGIDQVRPRFTTGVRDMPMQLLLTTAQLATFDAFYTSTIFGSLAFDWKHPRTGLTAEFRFKERPGPYQPLTGDLWRVPFILEMLP
jgi:hypothetical protein